MKASSKFGRCNNHDYVSPFVLVFLIDTSSEIGNDTMKIFFDSIHIFLLPEIYVFCILTILQIN